MRRLLLLGSTVVFVDVAFYTAITPLLPDYVDRFDLSKASAGVLSGAYAAGTLLAALPAGLLAARIGPRRALIAGVLLLGLASIAFGFAEHVLVLDAARFAQGVAGALAWSGALSWLILAAPSERRGAVIGGVLGVAVVGELMGPLLGVVAGEVGTEAVFSSVLVLAAALALMALRVPEPAARERQRLGDLAAVISSRPVVAAASYVAAPALLFGLITVIVPLRIDELGGGPVLVAAGFTAGAALEAVVAPLVGRFSDRAGRLPPYLAGMLVCATATLLIPFAEALGVVLGALVAISVGAGLCFAPALAMLSDSAEATGLHQGLAAGLTNMAWASGQVLGGVGGGALAGATGDALPCLLVAGWLAVTALIAWRSAGRRAATI